MLYSLYTHYVIIFMLYIINTSLSYELIQRLPLGLGVVDIESIVWDSTNEEYYIASLYSSEILPFSEDITEDPDYNKSDTKYNSFTPGPDGQLYPINIWRNLGAAGTAFNNDNDDGFTPNPSNWRPAGMEIISSSLFVVDFYNGRVVEWDIETRKYVNSILINNVADKPANLDGLCHDMNNPNMLYIGDFGYNVNASSGVFYPTGYESVYAVNTNDWSWNRIYSEDTDVEGATDGYTIHPNGCVVVDGILYTVDSDFDHTQKQGFSMYDIKNNKWSVEYDILPETGGDGLVYIDEIDTFFTTDYEEGTLSKYKPNEDDKFIIVYQGMVSPADMDYNSDERILAIPELNTGFVNFIELDDDLFMTTTEYFTTTQIMATTEPTTDNTEKIAFITACFINLFIILII